MTRVFPHRAPPGGVRPAPATARCGWAALVIGAALLAGLSLAGAAAAADTHAADSAGGGGSSAAEARRVVWHTDYRKAAALAAELRRPLLLCFTGSDWCDRCQLLKAEVFDTPVFVAWARKTVVLVEVDFPQTIRQDARLRKQNKLLARRFAAFLKDGYPTVILLDRTGTRILGELVYADGDPEAWTREADRLIVKAR